MRSSLQAVIKSLCEREAMLPSVVGEEAMVRISCVVPFWVFQSELAILLDGFCFEFVVGCAVRSSPIVVSRAGGEKQVCLSVVAVVNR